MGDDRRYQRFFERVPVGLYQTTPDGTILDINPAMLAMLGYESRETMASAGAEGLYARAEDRLQWQTIIESEGVVHDYVVQLRRADGSLIWVRENTAVVTDSAGKALYYEGSLEDITQSKQAEEALAAERYLMTMLMDSVPDAIYFKDDQSRFFRINQATALKHGLKTPEEALGKSDFDFFVAETAQRYYDYEQAIIRTGEPVVNLEEEEVWSDRVPTWASTTEVPLRDEAGRVVGILGVSRDITERKLADLALQESEERFRQLAEHIDEIFWLKTPDQQRLIYISPAFERLWGCSAESIRENSPAFTDYLHPDDRERVRAAQPKQLDGTYDEEYRVIHPDGTIRWMRSRAFPIHDEAGNVARIAGITQDITQQKADAAALQESEMRYRGLVENATDVVFIVGLDGRFLFVNPAGTRLSGYSTEELLGMRYRDVIAEDWQQELSEFFQIQLSERLPETRSEFPVRTRDGEVKWVEQTTSLLFHGSEPVGWQGIVRDVTARKHAEIAELEQRMLVEALHDGAAAITRSLELDVVLDRILSNVGRVVPNELADIMLIEDGMARIARCRGYSERGLEEPMLRVRLPVDTTANLKRMIETIRPVIVADTQQDPAWIAFPETAWIRSHVGAPITLDGEVIGFLGMDSAEPNAFTRAHADRLQAFANQVAIAVRNAQLFEAQRQHAIELEARNRELDAFSHTVAHDLRSPLSVIIGYLGLLKEHYDRLPQDAADGLRTIAARADLMNEMIEELLQLAHLRSYQEVIGNVDMQQVTERALIRFEERIKERGITLTVQPDLPQALGHAPWLEEVVANLIGNAVKYIGKHNVAPWIAVRGSRQGDVVRYEVEDNGLGIKAEDQAGLFDMFSRFHPAEDSGTGLGLSIVERIVTRLKGEVGVESAAGQGSRFWFSLPAPCQISEVRSQVSDLAAESGLVTARRPKGVPPKARTVPRQRRRNPQAET